MFRRQRRLGKHPVACLYQQLLKFHEVLWDFLRFRHPFVQPVETRLRGVGRSQQRFNSRGCLFTQLLQLPGPLKRVLNNRWFGAMMEAMKQMKQTLLLRIVGTLFVTLAVNGCSTATPIVSEWRNPAQASGSFRRLMIVGPSGDASVQRNFEDEFVAQLAAMGVDALASYRYMPDTGETTENILKQAAQEARADGLLLMRPVRVEEKTNYPGVGPPISFGIFGSNVGAEWYGIPGASGPYRYNEYTSETALYDVARNELVWTGTIKGKEPTNVQTAIKSYVQTVTKALAAQDLLPKR
jgi:hypothetical protein